MRDTETPSDPAARPEGRLTRRRLLGGAAGVAGAAVTGAAVAADAGRAPADAATALARPPRPRGSAGVTLRWLGNNAWDIRFGGTTVLIDPWVTRFRTGTYTPAGADPATPVVSDPATVDRFVTAADTVLVTHGHYDHLPDVPHIARRTGATVLGTETHLNLLRALGAPEGQLSEVRGGESILFDGYAVDVLRSAHSLSGPHRRLTFGGTRPAAPPPPPRVISDLVEGGTLAYLVTVGDFRMLSLGSANYLGRELRGLRPDLVFVQPGGAAVVDYVPRLLDLLDHPPLVVPTHWDDFDHPLTEPARDWGGLEPLGRAVREASPRAEFVVVDHLETFEP